MTVRKLKISCRGWVFRVYTHLEGDVSFSGFMLIKEGRKSKGFPVAEYSPEIFDVQGSVTGMSFRNVLKLCELSMYRAQSHLLYSFLNWCNQAYITSVG